MATPKQWNTLPLEWQSISLLTLFKTNFKAFLFRLVVNTDGVTSFSLILLLYNVFMFVLFLMCSLDFYFIYCCKTLYYFSYKVLYK